MKPHGLNLSLEYQIDNVKKKTKTSKIEGYIELGQGKSKVVIPMRSFVANFLRIIHSHFNKTGTYSLLKTAVAPSGNDGYGIQIGKTGSAVQPTDTTLNSWTNASITHSANSNLITPTVVGNDCKFTISRTFTSIGDDPNYLELGIKVKDINTASAKTLLIRDTTSRTFTSIGDDPNYLELGIKVKDINTASAKTLLIRDTTSGTIDESGSISVDYSLQVTHDSSNGGFVLNAIKFIYNVMFNGSLTASPLLTTAGTNLTGTWATEVDATTASYFWVASAIADNYGIVVGIEYDDKPTSPNTSRMTLVTSNLVKSATNVGNITINGSNTYFTISREFTNTGSTPINLNRIGILTRSLTLLVVNNTGSNIVLQPNQKLKVTYTLSTTC